jgi:hypothetical protein
VAFISSVALSLPAEAVEFTYRAPTVGQAVIQTALFDMAMKVAVKVDGDEVQSMSQKQGNIRKKEETILEVNEGRPSRVKVTYKIDKESQATSLRGVQTTTSPVAGKTYIVEKGKVAVVVSDLAGNKPPEAELAVVKKDYKSIGKMDPLAVFFKGQNWAMGDSMEVPTELAHGMFGDDTGLLEVKKYTFTFMGKKKMNGMSCGIFDTALIMSGKPAPSLRLSMNFTGETLVSIKNSTPISMDLKGTVEMKGFQPAQKLEMIGEGESNIFLRREYK